MKRIALILAVAVIVLTLAACDIIISGSRQVDDPPKQFTPPCDPWGPYGINASGDINSNDIAYEIADAVMFTNYFVSGLSAFGTHVEQSILATDVNGDCQLLGVADLVYMIRVIVGDVPVFTPLAPVSARVTYYNEVFTVDTELGAAHIVMSGDVTPELLANNMEMKYAFNGLETRILIFSTEAQQSFAGRFLQVAGDIVSTDFSTPRGAAVNTKVVPVTFVVHQNYPNPFDSTTTIRFTVPGGGAWRVVIRNYTGTTVAQFSGISESGFEDVIWDATGLPQGSYFYTVTAVGQSITKKALYIR